MISLIVFGSFLIVCLAGAGYLMSRMPGRSFSGPLPELSVDELLLQGRLRSHVEMLAGTIGERNYRQQDNLERSAAYIERQFQLAGLPIRSLSYQAAGIQVRNIEAEIRGSAATPAVLIVGAHYDSVINSPGANDNASGVAALLELARLFHPGEVKKTLRLVAFVNEEPPMFKTSRMGSWIYAQQLRRSGDHLAGMIALETIGYYTSEPLSQKFPLPMLRLFYPCRGDFLALVGNQKSRDLLKRGIRLFRQHAALPAQGIVAPGWLPGIDWSDHWSFWKIGCPAIMVTDTALFRYPYYHDSKDTPEKLNYTAYTRVVSGLHAMVRALATE